MPAAALLLHALAAGGALPAGAGPAAGAVVTLAVTLLPPTRMMLAVPLVLTVLLVPAIVSGLWGRLRGGRGRDRQRERGNEDLHGPVS